MGHDEPAHQSRGRTPRCRETQCGLTFFVLKVDVEGPGKVLAEFVRGRHLQRLAVAHHALTGHGVRRTRETLAGRLDTQVRRHRKHLLQEVVVHLEMDLHRVGRRVGGIGVGGVSFLPEELRGAQEEPGAQFPPHDIRPLVEQQRQVAITLDPLGHEFANHRLGRGTHHDGLGEFFPPGVGHHRQFGTEALHVRGFLREITLGDEEREVRILRARPLDARIDLALHALPDGVAVGANHHRPAHGTIVGHLGLGHDVLVPLGKVFALGGQDTLAGHTSPLRRGLSLVNRRRTL